MSEKVIDRIQRCDMDKPFLFVSYSSMDQELVWRDVAEFQRRGYNVWLDERNLDKTKKDWKDDALEAIQDPNSILLIFYVSRHSLTSEPCYHELRETRSDMTKRMHKRQELKFIAVEAEPIGDLQKFADEVDDMIRADTSRDKAAIKAKIRTLSLFLEEFFQNNNARVRVKYKDDPSREGKRDYYEDILLDYCEAARNQAVQSDMPAPAAAPAAEPAPAVKPVHAGEKARGKTPAPAVSMPSGTVDDAMGGVTLAEIRARFSDAETVRAFRAVREGMPWGGKGAMDYLMAALLGGCNQVTKASPACQVLYYLHAVASGEPKGDALGATWTWSSNCRKVLGLERSGQIPEAFDQHFAALGGEVTLHEIAVRFQKAEEPPYQTRKNDLILRAAAELDAFLKR